MDANEQNSGSEDNGRRRAMGLLAKASLAEMQAAWLAIEPKPQVHAVRGPESGLVMVRGRIGGGGDVFNLGEATVSRATVRLGSGEIGHGQLLGNDRERARLAAIFDALRQRADYRHAVDSLIDAVESRIEAEDRKHAEQTAATRVDFFTMVRGDN